MRTERLTAEKKRFWKHNSHELENLSELEHHRNDLIS